MNDLVPMKGGVPAFSMSEVERIAGAIAKSGMFGIKDPYAVLTLCLVAQAEGQHPAVVFRDYSIISGKPSKKAEAMLRDFLSAGGRVEWHTLTDKEADATFSHPSGGSARIAWDHERAKKAGLGSNGMYAKYPRQMLRSRVISEGVRTVFPGATSGLYVPEEVVAFEPKDTPHDPQTGEIVESEATERQKVPGITAIKKRLGDLMRSGNAAVALEAFNALVSAHKDDLQTIRDANHEYWTGDGADSEGFKAWIVRRREDLAPKERSLEYQLLLSTLNECDSLNEYNGWLTRNGERVGDLDGEESRLFEALHDEKLAALKLLAEASA